MDASLMLSSWLDIIRSLDSAAVVWSQNLRAPWLDGVFASVSGLGSISFAFWLGLLFVLVSGKSKGKAGAAIWTAAFVSYNVSGILKAAFKVERPYEILTVEPAVWSTGYAFPSGHTAMAFALATVLSSHFPKFRAGFFLAAAAVGISRIYLGVHYPSDVLGGVLLGLLAGYWICKLIK